MKSIFVLLALPIEGTRITGIVGSALEAAEDDAFVSTATLGEALEATGAARNVTAPSGLELAAASAPANASVMATKFASRAAPQIQALASSDGLDVDVLTDGAARAASVPAYVSSPDFRVQGTLAPRSPALNTDVGAAATEQAVVEVGSDNFIPSCNEIDSRQGGCKLGGCVCRWFESCYTAREVVDQGGNRTIGRDVGLCGTGVWALISMSVLIFLIMLITTVLLRLYFQLVEAEREYKAVLQQPLLVDSQ